MSTAPMGLKARVAAVLEASGAVPLTMGEIIAQAGIDKTLAGEVSSALYKLRNGGQVKTIRGESSSKNGPRFVRRYLWAVKVVAKPAPPRLDVRAVSPLQMLGIGRIG
ncbi:MAG: hypothetical protein CGW95_06595 [Phenylobacterium zucineum]|nr:MAG: hypothetical protein CGW95_06595 [Phenylobacterium zucineum]